MTHPSLFSRRDALKSTSAGFGYLAFSALSTMALVGFRDDDMEYACLGVDSENPTGANQIYERLGFAPEKRTMAFRKPTGTESGV